MLREWRQVQAATENVELYRVLQNNTINLIADTLPETNIDLLAIKGIGAKKAQKYGQQILDIVAKSQSPQVQSEIKAATDEDGLSVSDFLSRINFSLAKHTVRVYGEISDRVSVRGKAVYFKIKDNDKNAVLECFAWKDTFDDKGAFPTEGAEVILEGQVQIYPPTGRFSLQVKLLELRGEGLLKKAYEKLRKELEANGAFDESRKQTIDTPPRTIALVTAVGSDAETDFKTHVGKYGMTVDLYDVRVEGIKSESQIVQAIKNINESGKKYDCIVITRGGGSLESLQSFNSKSVVKAVLGSKFPVISAVGHERDITLCDLVADVRVSTPTDAGKFISRLYENLIQSLIKTTDNIRVTYQKRLDTATNYIDAYFKNIADRQQRLMDSLTASYQQARNQLREQLYVIQGLKTRFDQIINRIKSQTANAMNMSRVDTTYHDIVHSLRLISINLHNQHQTNQINLLRCRSTLHRIITDHQSGITRTITSVHRGGQLAIKQTREYVRTRTHMLAAYNPESVLSRGYAIVADQTGKTIRSIGQIRKNELLKLRLIDGTITVKENEQS